MKKQKKWIAALTGLAAILALAAPAWSAYHHEGERDAASFLAAYPAKAGSKLDHCALCHGGGQYEKKGKMVSLGSCQWCHHDYGYDASGDIQNTLNPYGLAYQAQFAVNGRNKDAILAIEGLDSDGDNHANLQEILANRFPGDPNDHPGQVAAPARVYTRRQLMAMPRHTQFLLMNTSRSGDFYARYSGPVVADLLADAGMLAPTATSITVFAPDGWAQDHPLNPIDGSELYHVLGVYPQAVFQYDEEADEALNNDGWCDYSAPSCVGYNHGDPIIIPGGLKMILALLREGQPLNTGQLNLDNKLDGEGPYRVVPPQKAPCPPDQSSRVENWNGLWPHDHDWDHNAGAATRSVTIIKVNPLPGDVSDIDVLEAGWNFVDQGKLVIYGAIARADANNNGILDSEEKIGEFQDYNGDGVPDYRDPRTARFRHAMGLDRVLVNVARGAITNVRAMGPDDPGIPQAGRPAHLATPYGVLSLDITGLDEGETLEAQLVFPGPIPVGSKLFKILPDGWHEIPFGSDDGDNLLTVTMRDGDPATDFDGVKNGVIQDPIAVATEPTEEAGAGSGGGSDSSSCFLETILH